MAQLPHPAYRLHPAEDLFYTLAPPLADRITSMPRRPAVNGALAPLLVLRHVGRRIHLARLGHEVLGIVGLVGTYGHWLISRNLLDHHQRRISLGCPIGLQYFDVCHETTAVLH